jgi:hypothetical protein
MTSLHPSTLVVPREAEQATTGKAAGSTPAENLEAGNTATRDETSQPKGYTAVSASTATINPGGPAVLHHPIRNRRTAFTLAQRAKLGIEGLLILSVVLSIVTLTLWLIVTS